MHFNSNLDSRNLEFTYHALHGEGEESLSVVCVAYPVVFGRIPASFSNTAPHFTRNFANLDNVFIPGLPASKNHILP